MNHITRNSRCLVLAPHLVYPTRNGADILIDRRWCEFSHHVNEVVIIAQDRVISYVRGAPVVVSKFENHARSKSQASFRTILFFSHYLAEKFLTNAYHRVAKQYLRKMCYDLVVCSYISTASLINKRLLPRESYCIETHNDEIKWFDDIQYSTRNLGMKWVAWLSSRWLVSFIRKHESDFLYLHVSKADQAGYEIYAPNLSSYLAPVGCDVDDVQMKHPMVYAGRPVRLLFVGSLGVKMNFDALEYFSKTFEPVLRQGLPEGIEVRVVGSMPTYKVESLCLSNGWNLLANVSDEELTECYRWADFSLLPFAYATGGKLKLLKSMSFGVPFLATTAAIVQLDDVCSPSVVSDEPGDWLTQIHDVQKNGISQSQRDQIKLIAHKHSWRNIANCLYQHIRLRLMPC